MNTLEVTSVVASILAIVMFPLTLAVSIRRATLGIEKNDLTAVAFGDGNDETLRRRIRAFGNFIEYVPMGLMMLALIELAGAGKSLLWSVGGLLVAGRILHALGMLYSDNPVPRGAGMLMTYASFLVPAIWLLSNQRWLS